MAIPRECEKLRILFRRATSLPQLPGTAIRLIDAIDSDEVSARNLERIISADPALSAKMLRVANSALAGYGSHVGTIRGTILRLGLPAMRSMAVSLSISQIVHQEQVSSLFDVNRFAKHSLFVGVFSRYVFARYQRFSEFESAWSADEIMAAGVLHELSAALLASSAHDVFERAFRFAKRNSITISEAFYQIYEISMGELSGEASEAWGLPEVFAKTLRYVEEPWLAPDEFEAIACLHYANHIAEKFGCSLGSWPSEIRLAPEVPREMHLEAEELEFVFGRLMTDVGQLLEEVEELAA